jgi:hypothetical protein
MQLENYAELPFVVMFSLTLYKGNNTDDDTP